jgi:DNA-binding CsgD family transcriptional regulator
MDLSQQRFEQLVNLTYETLEDRQAWRTLLESLDEALDTRAVHMLGFDHAHGALSYSDGADMAPQIDMEYVRKYQFIDPRKALMQRLGPDEWMHCHEHFDERFVASDPFFQEFLIPNDGRYASACKLHEDESATVLLAFIRRERDGVLPPEAIEFVDRLRPHLMRACRIGIKHFVYSAQALVGYALVDKLNQPVILLTPNGKLVHQNSAARQLLKSTSLIKVVDGELVLPARYRNEFFQRCAHLEDEVRFADGQVQDPGFTSLHLTNEPGTAPDAMYGFFTTLVPERVMGSFGMRPLVMLFLYHPQSAQHVDSSLLVAAFGLSQAECRVALMLADGMQLKNIADALGVQYDTVRKQLLSIYQKTSTNRQPELVRLLLHLPSARVPVQLPEGANLQAARLR